MADGWNPKLFGEKYQLSVIRDPNDPEILESVMNTIKGDPKESTEVGRSSSIKVTQAKLQEAAEEAKKLA